ncbi:MAG: DUF1833 domain-containing protein [Proteobacteria bacterium]|nr:DUF1833 domain-containing protein [Pseudomonadota bacterium]
MSRTTSTTFREAIYKPETGEVFVLLLTITHADLADPIRLSTDNADEFTIDSVDLRGTESQGYQFLYLPMEIVLPDDSDETISSARISIDNVERSILSAIRALDSAPSITMQVVLASDPDTIEAQFNNFELKDVTADALVISGTLSLGNFLSEPFPGGSMLPSTFPGLF